MDTRLLSTNKIFASCQSLFQDRFTKLLSLALVTAMVFPSSFPVIFAARGIPISRHQEQLIKNLQTNLEDYPDKQVPLYDKFEATFAMNIGDRNPFNPNEVRVDGCFFEPGKNYNPDCAGAKIQPGFLYEEYQVLGVNSEYLAAAEEEYSRVPNSKRWKMRFAPSYDFTNIDAVETYQFCIRVRFDGDQTSGCGESYQFEVVNKPERPGFIEVSEKNPSYFSFSNGDPFIGIGLNIGWWEQDDQRLSVYKYYFGRMAEYKANLVRMWMTNSAVRGGGGGLLTAEKILSIQDKTLGKDYNLEEAWVFDQILADAEQKGIYILLTMEDAHQFGKNWGNNLYNKNVNPDGICEGEGNEAGAICLINPAIVTYQENIIRYIIARWGYSTSIFSWELYNEVDEVTIYYKDKTDEPKYWGDVINWHREMKNFIEDNDNHGHLINTSTGSFNPRPELYTELPFAQMHAYYLPSQSCMESPTDVLGMGMANMIQYYSQVVRESVAVNGEPGKPSIMGEFGLVGSACARNKDGDWNLSWIHSEALDKDDQGIHLHNGLWSSLMGGLSTSALQWHWQLHQRFDDAWWRHYKSIANFFTGVQTDDLNLMKAFNINVPSSENAPTDQTTGGFRANNVYLRVMGLHDEKTDTVYAWIQNTVHTWWNYVHYKRNSSWEYEYDWSSGFIKIPEDTIEVYGLAKEKDYLVEWWDPYETDINYQVTHREMVKSDDQGSLFFQIKDLTADIAIKIRPAGPALTVRLVADKQTVPAGGIVHTIATVTNPGSVNLKNVLLKSGSCSLLYKLLPAGEEEELDCDETVGKDLQVEAAASGTTFSGNQVSHKDQLFIFAKDGMVGSGSSKSCTEDALRADLNNSSAKIITFNCGPAFHKYLISLSSPILTSRSITIDGGVIARADGSGEEDILVPGIILSGSNLGRVFNVSAGKLLLKNLFIIGGSAHSRPEDQENEGGGAILNHGTVEISNSDFFGNWADFGGAIYNAYESEIAIFSTDPNGESANRTELAKNQVLSFEGRGVGGAIYNEGEITIEQTDVWGNTARHGGGIWNMGQMTLVSSHIDANNAIGEDEAPSGGGGLRNTEPGTVTIMDCQLASNKADYGGAIHNDSRGKVRIQTTTAEDGLIPGLTTFSNNLSNADGGAIFNNSSMSIGNSIFADNSSKKGGGGLTNWTSGIAKIWNTTFVTNSARNGGAIDSAGDGQVHLQNTTFSGNSASEFGGALVNYDSAMIDIKFSTFYENSASNGSAIGQMGGPITAGNSVFARPTQSSTSSLCNATVTSLGWNIADDTSCFLPQNTDLQPVDPLLDPLADNGGFTQTHALLPGSPAIDLIPFKDCALKFDQREVSRQQGSGCDSGAYELIQFSEFLFMPLVRGK